MSKKCQNAHNRQQAIGNSDRPLQELIRRRFDNKWISNDEIRIIKNEKQSNLVEEKFDVVYKAFQDLTNQLTETPLFVGDKSVPKYAEFLEAFVRVLIFDMYDTAGSVCVANFLDAEAKQYRVFALADSSCKRSKSA